MPLTPEGSYTAVAVRQAGKDGTKLARWGRAGKNKTKQVLIYFQITEGPHAGTVRPWFGYFGKQSYKRTLEALRFCGWKGDDVLSIETQPMDQVVEIVIEHDEYEGKTRNRIAWVNRRGGGTIQLNDPMSDQDLREFAAQLRGYAQMPPEADGERVTTGGNSTQTQTQSPFGGDQGHAGEQLPLDDSDIPF